MADINRKIQELLSDYAESLRDGCLPVFLKSLTRQEGRDLASSKEFWEAAEVVRVLNGVGFADKAAIADARLFASRVDANIASRLKKAKGSPRAKRTNGSRSMTKAQKTEKLI
jgi:hypothetical protein